MDPLTAIGLVSNILSFIDFSTQANRSSGVVVEQLKIFSTKLLVPDDSTVMGQDKALCDIATEYRMLSTQLTDLLEKIKPKDPKSKGQSLLSAFKNKMHEKKKQDIEQRLHYCSGQLALQLNYLSSRDTRERLETLVAASKDDSVKLERIQGHIDQLRQRGEDAFFSPEAKIRFRQLICLEEDAFVPMAQERMLKSLEFEGMHGRFDMVDEAHEKTFQWILNSPHEIASEYDEDWGEADSISVDQEPDPKSNQSGDSDHGREDEQLSKGGNQSTDGSHRSTLDEEPEDVGDAGSPSEDQAHIEDDEHDSESSCDNDNDMHQNDQSDGGDHQSRDAPDSSSQNTDLDVDEGSHQRMEEDLMRSNARELFINWLTSGSGIFHISGKLGSGKSTLMKFLCDHPRTRTELNNWAGGRTLVFANFFFWALGSERQKSLTGLCSTLLHDILEAVPDLMPAVLPEYWKKALATPLQAQKPLKISDSEIRTAFTKVIRSSSVSRTHCFCFFIDGLDEFHATTQDDHKTMAELLCHWTNFAPEMVKLCVSSREYNVFMNAFSPTRRLHLQDLTRLDLENFTQAKLSHVADQQTRETLVNQICEKAQGIFLWVALVVRSIREQIENGSTMEDLKEELDTLPEELDGLFAHILKSLKNTARKKAFLTFAMLAESKEYDHKVSLLAHSILDDYERDAEFSMSENFSQEYGDSMPQAERLRLAEMKLSGWCKGLVELDGSANLDYTHRSVHEFLQAPEVKAIMATITSRYNVFDIISQSFLAEMRLRNSRPEKISSLTMAGRIISLIILRREHGLEKPPYLFLDCLGSILNPLLWSFLDTTYSGCELWIPLSTRAFSMPCCTGGKQKQEGQILAPLYIMTHLGYSEYPLWKILYDPTVTDTVSKVVLLSYCCMDPNRMKRNSHAIPDVSVLQMILERGLLSPNTKTQFRPFSDDVSFGSGPNSDRQLSIWQYFLIRFATHYHVYAEKANDWHSQVFEAFLRHQPDLDFTISSTESNDKLVVELQLAHSQEKAQVSWAWANKGGRVTLYQNLSPRQWIERTELKDKERLLQLIDSQSGHVELESQEKAAGPVSVEADISQDASLEGVDQRACQHTVFQSTRTSIPHDPRQPELTGDPAIIKESISLSPHKDYRKPLVVFGLIGILIAGLLPFLLTAISR